MKWTNFSGNNALLIVGGEPVGAVWRPRNIHDVTLGTNAARPWDADTYSATDATELGSYRRRCDAKRAVELALSGGAAPMPGYVHPRIDHGFGPPWLMNERGASIFRRHLRKEKRKTRRERRRGRR